MLDKTFSDEVRVTVIATGLNADSIQELDNIQENLNTNYRKSEYESTAINREDEGHSFKVSNTKIDNNLNENNDNANKDSDSVMTFGDELDVPAFIRNRRE